MFPKPVFAVRLGRKARTSTAAQPVWVEKRLLERALPGALRAQLTPLKKLLLSLSPSSARVPGPAARPPWQLCKSDLV